jgi:hypothetical protein
MALKDHKRKRVSETLRRWKESQNPPLADHADEAKPLLPAGHVIASLRKLGVDARHKHAQERQLPDERRERGRRDNFEGADGPKVRDAGRAVENDLEVVMLVGVVMRTRAAGRVRGDDL